MEKILIKNGLDAESVCEAGCFTSCITFGRAFEALRADLQKDLKMLQREIGFKYVRFHGIFHDDMAIYGEDEDGRPRYYFQYFDKLFDFLLSIGLTPIVELSFMPSELATKKATVFWWKANGCPPTSYKKWGDLVRATVEHAVGRYGLDEVLAWRFEVWNEPNLKSFFSGTKEEYFRLYEESARAVKSVDPRLKVGGPSISGADFREDFVFLRAFLDFVESSSLPLDFITAHPYPTYWPLDSEGVKRMGYMEKNALQRQVGELRKVVDASRFRGVEIHLTEWNSSPSPRDLVHDTAFMAPFIIYNLVSTVSCYDSIGFWTASDIFEENGPGKSQFHGGFGLTNTLGIRKPSYHAYRFLSRMKGRIVYRSDKALVVEDGKVMHALFWNYCHYEEEFQDGDRRALTATCRDVFEKRNEDFLLDIDGLEAVECLLLGPSHGSVFDLWTERGAKEDLSPSEAEELSSLAEPARVPFSPGFTLGPHEVLYVEFSSGLSTSRMPSEA